MIRRWRDRLWSAFLFTVDVVCDVAGNVIDALTFDDLDW
jgi:hypothetical protein